MAIFFIINTNFAAQGKKKRAVFNIFQSRNFIVPQKILSFAAQK